MNFLSRFAQCIDNIPYRPLRYLTLLVTLAIPIIFWGPAFDSSGYNLYS